MNAKKTRKESFDEMFNRIDCDTGLIFVDTPEETRLIREIYRKYRDHSVQFWSIGQGLHEIDRQKQQASKFYPHKYKRSGARMGKAGDLDTRINPLNVFSVIEEDCREKTAKDDDPDTKHIYILRDLDKFLSDPYILRGLKDIIYLCSTCGSTIIVTGFGINVPTEIEKDTVFVKLNYPTKDEIVSEMIPNLIEQIEDYNRKSKEEDRICVDFIPEDTANACVGLTEDQILNVLQYTTTVDKKVSIDRILDEKKAIINKSDILEYWISHDTLDDIGGFGEIKEWFEVKKAVIKHVENAEKFGAEPPKGMLLLGVQGSGKTAIAKALAQSWNVGLIKLDIGKVFAGLVGESEKRMRQALAQIDAAGGIVVIDELDKGLSGAGSSDKTDGGTTNRVIGTMLTWLAETHPGVFLIATANDITALRKNHPELLRKGRFDEIWFSDVPNFEERKQIFNIHLKKRKRDPQKFDIDKLSAFEYIDTDNVKYAPTGAEIESAVKDAIQERFAVGGGKELKVGSADDITTQDILDKLAIIKPITKIAKETINAMRRWSSENARNVSSISKKAVDPSLSGKKKINMRTSTDENVTL
jgi:SpoVK/Ycf46/Vps4 family AAA+-type ATPase